MKKSMARIKFFGTLGIGWCVAGLLALQKDEVISLYLIGIFFILSIYSMFIKCEKCGTFMYRYNSNHHGLPHPKCFSFTKKCPACGIERL